MPKAAMDEYDAAVLGQHQVWLARQARLMHAKSKAKAMEPCEGRSRALCPVIGSDIRSERCEGVSVSTMVSFFLDQGPRLQFEEWQAPDDFSRHVE